MGDAYPELAAAQAAVETALRDEEERFAQTLSHGLAILERDMARLGGQLIPGETIFRLYDTYGFPVDLTADIARERGLALDLDGFEQAMALGAQSALRARAQSAWANNVAAMAQMIAAGLGIGVLPMQAARGTARAPRPDPAHERPRADRAGHRARSPAGPCRRRVRRPRGRPGTPSGTRFPSYSGC